MIERVEVVAYGRPASEALGAAVAGAQADNPLAPVTVVVPSNLAGLTARRLLGGGLVTAGGIANVSFVTPFRLAELLGADLLIDRRPLTNPALGAAVRLALADDPGPFAAVADHHATEVALAALYAELADVSESTLDRLWSDGGPAARRAVRFQRAIRQRLTPFHDEADLARAAARRPDLARVLQPMGELAWHLPAPTSAPLTELLAAVVAAAPTSVVVGVTGQAEADDAVWATLLAAGIDGVRPVDPSADGSGSPEGASSVQGPPSVPGAPSVEVPTAARIVSVTDADEEVRAVIRAVVALAESGVALDRLGIFHPTPDPYVAILEQQLAAADLPANGPSRRRLADSVAGRTLLAALLLPHQRWRRDRVLALVGLGPLRQGEAAVRPAAWETLSRVAGVVQGLDDWRDKLAHRRQALEAALAGPGQPVGQHRVAQIRRELDDVEQLGSFVDTCAASVEAVELAVGWPAKVEVATALLHQLLGPGHLHGSWPEAEQAAFERTESALARLAPLEALEPAPSHDVFVRALRAELDVARGRTGRFGQGVVYGPLASAAGHDLDAVFIVGCAEGLCPRPRRDDAMLPDTVRALAPGELGLRVAQLDDQHRAFLAALAAAPPGARTLTFPRGDLRGGGRKLPSRWLLDSASALAGTAVHATEFDRLDAPIVEVVPSFATGVTQARAHGALADRDLAAMARHRARGESSDTHPVAAAVARGLQAQKARRSSQFTEWDGNLVGQRIPSAADRSLSPSRLETWAACGYRYFLTHVLGLDDRDDPERVVDLSPLDRGSGVHAVLERFIGEVIERGEVPDPDVGWTPDQRLRLRAIAHEVFADYEGRGRTGRPLHWRLTKDDILLTLDEFLDVDDAYRSTTGSRPTRVELPFGLDGADPVVLTLPDGRTLAFRGRADRVDRVDDGRLLVSDYKTGRGSGYEGIDGDDPVQGGTTLQLGLYAEAAAQLLRAPATEAHYWMVNRDGHFARHGYPWTDDRRQRFLEVLGTIVEGIEAGVFPVVPGEWNGWRRTHETCAYCAFDSVCSRDRGEQAEATLEAPELRRRDPLLWEPTS